LKLIDTDPQPTRSFDDIPSQFNWADYGGDWTTPVKDQAYPVYCGSCYIFGTWGAFEAAINIASGNPDTDIDLSEQYGLSCINDGCNGCGGGWGSLMIENIVNNDPPGVPIESCMPYQADDSVPCTDKCTDWDQHTEPLVDPNDKLWQIADWGVFSISDSPTGWDILKTYILDKGPIALSMAWSDGMQTFFETHHNPTDVYENDDSSSTNHIISCVGWVDDIDITSGGYWILRNSHGTQNGYGGFVNLAYGCLSVGASECNWIVAEEWPEQESGPGPTNYDIAVFSDYTYESKYPHPGEEIQFTDISDGDVALREWDFNGDGVTDSNQKNPDWTYNQEGVYEVSLKVWNEWGLSNTRIKDIEVKQIWPPKAVCDPENYPEEPGDNNLEIHFDGRYSYDRDGGLITNYHWDFGDGTTAESSYLYHTFPESDTIYNVILTVTNNQGASGSTTCVVAMDQTIPPVTEIHHGYESNGLNCYSSTQKISISATDWTKVRDTFYRVDNGNWQRYVESEQKYIAIASEGEHTVEAYSIDFYGNQETPVKDTFIIDKKSPSLDVSLDGNEEDGWYINKVTVTMTGDDDFSGLDKIMYKYNTNEWIEYNGPFTINDRKDYFILYAMALDKAGNQIINEKEIFIKNINAPTSPTISGPSKTKPGEL
ncbi:MAG: PKD domain-containing protein, partial [Candidatus Thermoplasmatota archaeon]|nr:PKD domain-containing protein [Candidatus Thermoplasmatota archaeon]